VAEGASQVVPSLLQQPLEHECASHVQLPPTHSNPDPGLHAGPWPQWQVPFEAQPSDSMGSHAMHALPSIPHVPNSDGLQVFVTGSQQPDGQEVELQTQVELTQTCPIGHASALPQLQLPDVEQLSAVVESHAEHALPPAPHVANVVGSQAAPAQQPVAHVCEHPVQTLLTQLALLGHGLQAVPPVPQAWSVLPCWHTPVASQHPPEHEVPLQTQLPFKQTCPA
jgi:hypothetical protein